MAHEPDLGADARLLDIERVPTSLPQVSRG
jgi:hypothetical protein